MKQRKAIDEILADPLIHVMTRDHGYGVYEFKLGELDTIITIELGQTPDGTATKFFVSHVIHTECQMGPYRTSRPFDDNPERALSKAIRGLTDYYREAVKKGHKPKEAWLVKS